jgi:hypothetical protein
MSFKNVCLLSLAVSSVLFASACGSKSGGGGSSGSINCDTPDYSGLASAAPVQFTRDVMPIFGFSCYASDCHNSNDNNFRAGLVLGVHCQPMGEGANLTCVYPTTQDPNADPISDPNPLTPAILQAVYANLVNTPSQTVASQMRVVPGHPESSFLIDKLADSQNNKPYTSMCKDTDPSHEMNPGPCGYGMPQATVDTGLCQTNNPWFVKVATWIAQGAPAN